jgi:uncharacterized membrane protein YczE
MRPADTPGSLPVRLVRCVAGLVVCGVGITAIAVADLGLDPWNVFHAGVAGILDVSLGTVIIATGLVILGAWIPLRQRPGIGTILNALVIGTTVNQLRPALRTLTEDAPLTARSALLAGGIVAMALGSALYLGAGLGAGPRDGVMMGLAQRGWSVRAARTALELTALAVGWLLGGGVGIGTVAFALGVGPATQLFLRSERLAPFAQRGTDRHRRAAPMTLDRGPAPPATR